MVDPRAVLGLRRRREAAAGDTPIVLVIGWPVLRRARPIIGATVALAGRSKVATVVLKPKHRRRRRIKSLPGLVSRLDFPCEGLAFGAGKLTPLAIL